MAGSPIDIALPDEAATQRLGEDLARALRPGDMVHLRGDLGAGKTTLARAVIRAVADDEGLEVPSPTFTLVQSYELRLPVHHLDLYRLGTPDELDELGVEELAEDGVALVEWPEHGGDALPRATLVVELTQEDGARRAAIEGAPPAMERVSRSLDIRRFLHDAGWGAAHRRYLQGDASTRTYETVTLAGQAPRILMDAPAHSSGPPVRDGKPYAQIAHIAESVTPFVAIDRMLGEAGFAVPAIHAADLDVGLLLIEHLGGGAFPDPAGKPITERYEAAAELLAAVHARSWPREIALDGGHVHRIPDFDRQAMLIEVELLLDWYLPDITGKPVDDRLRRDYVAAWNTVLDRLAGAQTSVVLRDFHSPNIIWRAERQGLDRLGIIDFQDAMLGPAAYDVASLALDARVTISPALEAAIVSAYTRARAAASGFDKASFEEAYAIMGAQRNAKIMGLFVRLHRRDGKPAYRDHLPRVREYLARCLEHPALEPVARFCAAHDLLKQARA
ncbi:tRNA (adenosine(37)-N6)-threonylcarbamoyltransferase complex ATPase subunit type 1 TsaE [Mesorhizobium xinjiangense]|uniref:tRNA (adenosine(37)-N6)-threonylcarbamoyltransferase complex ATPase subunit type 1 TsaE n=1 Tax=Mesorhizobium xinjiangense TaxID=2678685 RepID=UPI0012ED4E45|nr:tRNA (adenosine(37)-N6)-threonylcarbamoyltransferase complex ATPase subunit type 1 TsaE [Mesorhizobium xinjiangense]